MRDWEFLHNFSSDFNTLLIPLHKCKKQWYSFSVIWVELTSKGKSLQIYCRYWFYGSYFVCLLPHHSSSGWVTTVSPAAQKKLRVWIWPQYKAVEGGPWFHRGILQLSVVDFQGLTDLCCSVPPWEHTSWLLLWPSDLTVPEPNSYALCSEKSFPQSHPPLSS